MSISIKNMPRRSCKTASIKLKVLELTKSNYDCTYSRIIIITNNMESFKCYKEFLASFEITNRVHLINAPSLNASSEIICPSIKYLQTSTRGVRNCLILIDDAFLLQEEYQTFILNHLCTPNIDIIGVGTLEEAPSKKLFKNYV